MELDCGHARMEGRAQVPGGPHHGRGSCESGAHVEVVQVHRLRAGGGLHAGGPHGLVVGRWGRGVHEGPGGGRAVPEGLHGVGDIPHALLLFPLVVRVSYDGLARLSVG